MEAHYGETEEDEDETDNETEIDDDESDRETEVDEDETGHTTEVVEEDPFSFDIFKCEHCSKNVFNKNCFKTHMEENHKHKCAQCKYAFKDEKRLDNHIKIAHKTIEKHVEPQECKTCRLLICECNFRKKMKMKHNK